MSNLRDKFLEEIRKMLKPYITVALTDISRRGFYDQELNEEIKRIYNLVEGKISLVYDKIFNDVKNNSNANNDTVKSLEKKIEGKETTIKNLITELEEKDNLIKELETDKDPLSKKLNTLQNSEKQLLQIFKEYKDEIMLFETFQANIRREQAMFLSSTVKEVRKSLEESDIDKACQDAWIKELVDNYNSSLKLSSKLIDDSIMNLIVNIKEEIDNTINQINK